MSYQNENPEIGSDFQKRLNKIIKRNLKIVISCDQCGILRHETISGEYYSPTAVFLSSHLN